MGPDRKKALPPENGRDIAAETLPRKPSSIDEGGGNEIVSAQTNGSKIDIDRIRDAMKRRRCDKDVNKNVHAIDDDIDPEACIENELENGVELKSTPARRKQRL